MTQARLLTALGLLAIAAPLAAHGHMGPPPAGSADTRYCMHIEAITGSRIEQVKCWTRAEWADQGVDLEADWPREGVRIIG